MNEPCLAADAAILARGLALEVDRLYVLGIPAERLESLERLRSLAVSVLCGLDAGSHTSTPQP